MEEEKKLDQISVSTEDVECLVCTNIPIEVMETECCGSIICGDCGS